MCGCKCSCNRTEKTDGLVVLAESVWTDCFTKEAEKMKSISFTLLWRFHQSILLYDWITYFIFFVADDMDLNVHGHFSLLVAPFKNQLGQSVTINCCIHHNNNARALCCLKKCFSVNPQLDCHRNAYELYFDDRQTS